MLEEGINDVEVGERVLSRLLSAPPNLTAPLTIAPVHVLTSMRRITDFSELDMLVAYGFKSKIRCFQRFQISPHEMYVYLSQFADQPISTFAYATVLLSNLYIVTFSLVLISKESVCSSWTHRK